MSFFSLNIWSPYWCVPSHSSVRYSQMSLCSIIETEPLFCYTCLSLLLPWLQYSGHVDMTHCVIIIIIPSCCLHHFWIVLVFVMVLSMIQCSATSINAGDGGVCHSHHVRIYALREHNGLLGPNQVQTWWLFQVQLLNIYLVDRSIIYQS